MLRVFLQNKNHQKLHNLLSGIEKDRSIPYNAEELEAEIEELYESGKIRRIQYESLINHLYYIVKSKEK